MKEKIDKLDSTKINTFMLQRKKCLENKKANSIMREKTAHHNLHMEYIQNSYNQ